MLPRFAAAFLVAIVVSSAAPRAAHAAWTWFPAGPNFAPLTADPHEPRFGFDLVESNRASGFVGERFALAGFGRSAAADAPPRMRLVVDGMLWAWLSRRPGFNFPLESVDGSFGLAVDWLPSAGPWTARLRYGHDSSHLGDGGYDIEARRIVYSRESFEAIGSWAGGRGLRAYVGPAFLVHGEPQAPAFQLQFGGEARRGNDRPGPYAAVDFRLKAETDYRLNQSYQAGWRFGPGGRSARVSLGYEAGTSERGQEWQQTEHFLRAGVVLGD